MIGAFINGVWRNKKLQPTAKPIDHKAIKPT
jgi:hypothetical protein